MNPLIAALSLVAISLNSGYADLPASKPLFDGQTLSGWQGDPQYWQIEDGAITANIPEGETLEKNKFLFWEGKVHDFELSLEFRISGHANTNSGIQFRAKQTDHGEAEGYQADLDAGGEWLGRIYDENTERKLLAERGTHVSISPDGRKWVDEFRSADSYQKLYKPGDWNEYRITARASHVEIWINGELFTSFDDHDKAQSELSGQLALQLHSGEGPAKIQFRNISLIELGKTEKVASSEDQRVEHSSPQFTKIPSVADDGHILNLGFENGNLEDWIAEGDAWAEQPLKLRRANTRTRREENPKNEPEGDFWIGKRRKVSEPQTGVLTSIPFEVTHRWASYLIAGGDDINQTRFEIRLAETGAVLHSASGNGDESSRRKVVDLRSVLGQQIILKLVDQSTTTGGFIGFDDFSFYDKEPNFDLAEDTRQTRDQQSPVLWHLQPNPAEPSQVPNVDAQTVVRDMKLMPGFAADLVAAEPDIHQPIAFTFDDRGRIWVAEAYSYPSKQPEGKGLDRIIIFEDADSDGTFETRKIFAEGLNLVSGFELGFGGVWVGAAPELLFIPDRDGDDKPDGPPEVLLDGWGIQDTHETLNNFCWGPDGWLYGLQGVFVTSNIGIPGSSPEERTMLTAGVWRYHPTRHVFEIYARGGSNQWGLDFNEMGHLFITHCRSRHGQGGTSYIIRNGNYWQQNGRSYPPFISNRAPSFAPDMLNYLLASARYGSGEGGAGKPGSSAVYGGHSHVGTMIYLGDNWPDIYRDHLFTNNLHGHQINHQHNVRRGSGYETFHAGYDMMYVPDNTFMGIDLKYGPDGGVYIIDWCDHQHCHSSRDDIWERTNGRLYRVTWEDTWEPKSVSLRDLTDTELSKLHTHKNEWYTRTARRLLQERAATGTLQSEAIAMLKKQAFGAETISDQIRAILTLHVTENLDETDLESLLAHPHDVIRSWGITFATDPYSDTKLPSGTLLELATQDPSPTVRLALASAMPDIDHDQAWAIGEALAQHEEDALDRYIPKMIWYGLAQQLSESDLPRLLDIATQTTMQPLIDSIHWRASETEKGRDLWLKHIARSTPDDVARSVRLLAYFLNSESTIEMPKEWESVVSILSDRSSNSPEGIAVLNLSAIFGDKSVLAAARSTLTDTSANITERQGAFDLLKRASDPEAGPVYISILKEPAFRKAATAELAKLGKVEAADAYLQDFQSLSATERSDALSILTSRPSFARRLLDAVVEGTFRKGDLNALHFRQLGNLGDSRIDSLIEQIWTEGRETSASAKETIAHLKEVYTETAKWELSLDHGKTIFNQLCAACHTIDGSGGNLGPDLTGAWKNGVDYYLDNIVDPNSVIGTDFQLNIISLKDGSVISGMIDRETDKALTVRTITDTITVSKDSIKSRQIMEQSMMPSGLLETLPDRDMVTLMKFLLSER